MIKKPYVKNNKETKKFEYKKSISPKPKVSKDTTENEDDDECFNLEGRNAVLEALNHGKPIDKILVKKGGIEGSLKVIAAKASERRIVVQEVDKIRLDNMSQTGNHQGIIAMCPAHEYAHVQDMLMKAKEKNEDPFIIILDGITDPHNLGAIIRSAECCGAHGVIIPKRRAVGLTAVVSKTSAGALAHVLIARVPNITNTMEDLKKEGLWIACATVNGDTMYKSDLRGALALVIGGEAEGVGRLVREKCDFVVSIPLMGRIASLNASVAAGVLMYEVVRQRKS